MEQLLDKIQPQQRWHSLLQTWRQVSERLRMQQPITLSRCSTLPLFILFTQSLVICLLEACGVALGVAGGVTQLAVTTLFLAWLAVQLELSDVLLHHHGPLLFANEEQQSASSFQQESLEDMEEI